VSGPANTVEGPAFFRNISFRSRQHCGGSRLSTRWSRPIIYAHSRLRYSHVKVAPPAHYLRTAPFGPANTVEVPFRQGGLAPLFTHIPASVIYTLKWARRPIIYAQSGSRVSGPADTVEGPACFRNISFRSRPHCGGSRLSTRWSRLRHLHVKVAPPFHYLRTVWVPLYVNVVPPP
jgi:hypothetical protein